MWGLYLDSKAFKDGLLCGCFRMGTRYRIFTEYIYKKYQQSTET